MSKAELRRLKGHPVSGHSIFSNPDVKLSQASQASQASMTATASQQYAPPVKKRPVRRVPASLLDQCTICMEEKLWSQAFSLLSSSLSAGSDYDAPACIPPPQHLAIAATIALHPGLTTRTTSADKHKAADDAMRYLLDVMAAVDVEESGLKEALRFTSNVDGRLDRTKRKKRRSGPESDDEDADNSRIRSPYADKFSLWTHAEDFWAVVGWAFNCSVRHKARWRRWKIFLGFMLDVLEDDLKACVARAPKPMSKGLDVSQSLIAHYTSSVRGGRNNRRHLMRAVTADGSDKSMALFKEVWENETQAPTKDKDERPAKRRKLDIDNGEFGDYFNESDDDVSEGRKGDGRCGIKKRRSKQCLKADAERNDITEAERATFEESEDPIEDYGGMDSIRLRQRFLALFTQYSAVAPAAFVDTEEILSVFTEFIKPLPLEVFQQFVLPSKPYLSDNLQASLNEMVSRPLLGISDSRGLIDQREFERTFATSTACNTTAVDNAKVSLLTEGLLRALESNRLIKDLAQLTSLVSKGVGLRNDKVAFDGRKKAGKKAEADELARQALHSSGQRMNMLLSVIEHQDIPQRAGVA